MTAIAANFPDALDARFADIFDGDYAQLPDMISKFFGVKGPGDTPQRQDYRTSSIGAFGDVPAFTGTVTYDDVAEGYDGTITPLEYASGFMIQRRLFDYDQTGIIEGKPSSLALAFARTRQKHAAQWFNNATSVDSTWNSFTENVALASNSHTTRASGVSTATGFDNLVTTALSTVAIVAARIQFRGFRDDRGNRMSNMPNALIVPVDLCQQAYEIIESMGVPENATNAANYNKGKYEVIEWEYITDTNNWAIADTTMMKKNHIWYQDLPYEFAMVEDFDTLVGKWRLYARHGHGHRDWRHLLFADVS
jgi:hypothetical protein